MRIISWTLIKIKGYVPFSHLLDFKTSLVFVLVIPSRCETMGDFISDRTRNLVNILVVWVKYTIREYKKLATRDQL